MSVAITVQKYTKNVDYKGTVEAASIDLLALDPVTGNNTTLHYDFSATDLANLAQNESLTLKNILQAQSAILLDAYNSIITPNVNTDASAIAQAFAFTLNAGATTVTVK